MTGSFISLICAVNLVLPPSQESLRGNEPAPPALIEKKDIPYYEGEGKDPKKHRLDLFIPKGAKGAKVLVFVHGGAWVQGDKGFMGIYSSFGKYLARNGIVAVVISYRLAPGVKHPGQAEDVARAIAWTVKNIGQEGGDPGQIYLCGHSAGGHLVSLIGCDSSYLVKEGVNSKVIRGVVSLSGIFDVSKVGFGHIFGWEYEGKKGASPVKQVRAGLPPFLLICADKDFPVCSPEECRKFKKALEAKGNQVDLQVISRSNHLKVFFDAMQKEKQVSNLLLKFLESNGPIKDPG
ncbi:MAG: alpha/beta hydrolase [Gemmataceae bacterium]|nr:alpha/beta hydrolase [Gemmataceae bacterium]